MVQKVNRKKQTTLWEIDQVPILIYIFEDSRTFLLSWMNINTIKTHVRPLSPGTCRDHSILRIVFFLASNFGPITIYYTHTPLWGCETTKQTPPGLSGFSCQHISFLRNASPRTLAAGNSDPADRRKTTSHSQKTKSYLFLKKWLYLVASKLSLEVVPFCKTQANSGDLSATMFFSVFVFSLAFSSGFGIYLCLGYM